MRRLFAVHTTKKKHKLWIVCVKYSKTNTKLKIALTRLKTSFNCAEQNSRQFRSYRKHLSFTSSTGNPDCKQTVNTIYNILLRIIIKIYHIERLSFARFNSCSCPPISDSYVNAVNSSVFPMNVVTR